MNSHFQANKSPVNIIIIEMVKSSSVIVKLDGDGKPSPIAKDKITKIRNTLKRRAIKRRVEIIFNSKKLNSFISPP